MRYHIYELHETEHQTPVFTPMGPKGSIPDDILASLRGVRPGEEPWRVAETEQMALALVRHRYCDATPIPLFHGPSMPNLVLWSMPSAMGRVAPVLAVVPIADTRQDKKYIGNWVPRADNAPFHLRLWMSGVVPAPAEVLVTRLATFRNLDMLGTKEARVVVGRNIGGAVGFWILREDGTYSLSMMFDDAADVGMHLVDGGEVSELLRDVDNYLVDEDDAVARGLRQQIARFTGTRTLEVADGK